MSFALDCIKPTVAKSDCDSTEGHCNNIQTRRSFSTGKISIPKSIYLSLKRDKVALPSFVSGNNVLKDSTLTRVARPNQQNERRKEISLNLWIQEAKNVPAKKRYFCEIYLDNALYARTTTKLMGDMLFWGEEFNLCNLDDVKMVALLLWKCSDDGRSKKKRSQQQLICQINIPSQEINHRMSVEKWYCCSSSHCNQSSPDTPTSNLNPAFAPLSQAMPITSIVNSSTSLASNEPVPMLRVKAKYQQLDVLPISAYNDLIKFLNENTVRTLAEIESYLKVKAKEDLAQNLIKVIHKQGSAVSILCDLIINEINKSDDKNLILRGNTMASKAMEIYLKLVGEKYLKLTLSDFINRVLLGQDDCEVDPQKDRGDYGTSTTPTGHSSSVMDKGTSQYSLQQRQESLLMNVDMIWAKIMSSSMYFPKDLKTVFVTLRHRLTSSKHCQSHSQLNDKPDLCDRIISACIFLRYICPAILTPSLFGLIPEYPDNAKVTRTFTLVAKCIQTLANFSNLSGTKETYMVFMNHFIEGNFATMKNFLREISGQSDCESGRKDAKTDVPVISAADSKEYLYWENLSTNVPGDSIDMALCLATLHRQLEDCLQSIAPQVFSANLRALHAILKDINSKLQSEDSNVDLMLKNSHSYQNFKSQQYSQFELPKRPSLGTPDYHIANNCHAPEHKFCTLNNSNRSERPKLSRVTNNSHSVESTPTHHQRTDKPYPATDYLMSQSMVENGNNGQNQSRINCPPSAQLDKEWKAVLSASYVYNNKLEDQFFAGSRPLESEMKSSTSSGYQTLSRSTDSVEKASDDIVILPKSPTSSLKPSVKKCKQARRQTDVIPRLESFNQTQQNNVNIKEPTPRSVSTEEIRHIMTQNYLNCFDDSLDSSSTQTLTAANISKPDTQKVPEVKHKLTSSVSMPVVHSYFDVGVNQASDFYSAFQGLPNNGSAVDSSNMSSPNESVHGTVNERSAFRDTTKYKQSSQVQKGNQGSFVMINDTEKIKCSLNNLRQTLNSRMKQLLLADRTTIELELERVRLMRQICETPSSNGTTFANNFIVFSGRKLENVHFIGTNGSNQMANANTNKTLSVKKYLDLAESVLYDAYSSHINPDHCRVSIADRQMEHLLVQIFQTNQNLQNNLMCCSDMSDTCPINTLSSINRHIEEQNSFNNHSKDQSLINRVHRSGSNKQSFSSHNIKSNSLGSLSAINNGHNNHSSSSSTTTMIEIIDAV